MASKGIISARDAPSHMLEVSCQARFPEEHIQKFGLVSIGRIILTLSSSRVILCATASLDGASY
jgi:hypothetical protein